MPAGVTSESRRGARRPRSRPTSRGQSGRATISPEGRATRSLLLTTCLLAARRFERSTERASRMRGSARPRRDMSLKRSIVRQHRLASPRPLGHDRVYPGGSSRSRCRHWCSLISLEESPRRRTQNRRGNSTRAWRSQLAASLLAPAAPATRTADWVRPQRLTDQALRAAATRARSESTARSSVRPSGGDPRAGYNYLGRHPCLRSAKGACQDALRCHSECRHRVSGVDGSPLRQFSAEVSASTLQRVARHIRPERDGARGDNQCCGRTWPKVARFGEQKRVAAENERVTT